MSTARKLVLVVLALPLLVFGILSAVWAMNRPADGQVIRGIEIAGQDVSGKGRQELTKLVQAEADTFETTTVSIITPDFTLRSTAGDLGVAVDVGATVKAALAAGRDEAGPWGPVRYAQSFFGGRQVALRVRVEEPRVATQLVELEGTKRTEIDEPSIDATGETIVLVAGTKGRAIDPTTVVGALPTEIDDASDPIDVETEQVVIEPRVSDAAVQTLVDRANTVTANPITVKVGERSAEIPGTAFRSGFSLSIDGTTPNLVVDPEVVGKVLSEQGGLSGANPTGVRFDLVNGVPTPIPGQDAAACCAEDAPKVLADALLAGSTDVTLGTKPVTAAEGVEWAESLGIKEVVGEFTTKHPCCPPRVTNIHRISDLTRGVIIAPGETFSVNDFVGRRTAEKGFVSAPVIEQGEFRDDIGGGVSQYATTLFNAAFFGGLDIPDHKAHSIYISRYPFGREATLAYPSVDLKIRNNTPYGVMIWPTYTNSTITVQLWSTRVAIGEQTSINKTGGCGFVKVTRTRTFVADGRTENDTFEASYDCDPPKS